MGEFEDLISIVLPVFNGEKYLRESIDSVLAQTWTNWELLIMDDCSSDASADIAKEYAARDARIRYHRNERNLRLPENLNAGFSLARGNYLSWTSDDNRFRPTALEKMHQALLDNDAQFAFASCRIIDENGKEIEYITVGENSVKNIVGADTVGACFLYTREVYETIGRYDPQFELVEDFDYWQRVFARFNAVAITEILYDYRWHDGSLTSTKNKERFDHALERMLLKNRALFGNLDIEQNYRYYHSLSNCRNGRDNPYKRRAQWYSALYFAFFRVPRKIKREWKKLF